MVTNYSIRKQLLLEAIRDCYAQEKLELEKARMIGEISIDLWEEVEKLDKEAAGRNPETFEDDHDPHSGETLFDRMPEMSPEVSE